MPAHFPDSYLFWALLDHVPAVPAHFISWASWTHLLLFYLFYFPWAFPKSFGLRRPNYHILTSYYFQAYWPLSQPHEFTNSFFGLSQPIYFFFTSYYSHGFTTSFFGFPQPICLLFTTYYFCGLADHYSCHSSLLGFTLLFSLLIFFILLSFFCHWVLCQKWAAIIGKLDFCYLFLAKIQICSIHFGNSQFGLCYFKLIVSSILIVNSLGTN